MKEVIIRATSPLPDDWYSDIITMMVKVSYGLLNPDIIQADDYAWIWEPIEKRIDAAATLQCAQILSQSSPFTDPVDPRCLLLVIRRRAEKLYTQGVTEDQAVNFLFRSTLLLAVAFNRPALEIQDDVLAGTYELLQFLSRGQLEAQHDLYVMPSPSQEIH